MTAVTVCVFYYRFTNLYCLDWNLIKFKGFLYTFMTVRAVAYVYAAAFGLLIFKYKFIYWGYKMLFVLFLLLFAAVIIPKIYFIMEENRRVKQNVSKVYNKITESKISENEYDVIINVPGSTEAGFNISASRFDVKEPRAVVYVVHGALEHRGRYRDFIKFLNQEGFAAVSADCRGHGKSIDSNYPAGYMRSLNEMIEDMYAVTEYIKSSYPSLDIYMFAHSMGSMFARHYLAGHDIEIKKLVLSGVVGYKAASPIGVWISEFITFYRGKYSHSLTLGALNGMEGEDRSWISINKKNLENIENDPLVLKVFRNMADKVVFEANMRLAKVKNYRAINTALKILCISGDQDGEITGGEKGLLYTTNSLHSMGYRNVKNIVYENMRHEVLNETDNKKVYNDILQFYKK